MTNIRNKLVSDIAASAIRIDNDINGNPRYYVPFFMLPRLSDDVRRKAGLAKYRGKRFGAGYVIQSYSLEYDLGFVVDKIAQSMIKTYLDEKAA